MKPRARGSSLHPLRRYWWEPQLELGNKNSLAFASDIGSLVVIGRFRDSGITYIGTLSRLMIWQLSAISPFRKTKFTLIMLVEFQYRDCKV